MSSKNKTAIASSIQSLEDFLKTDICQGAHVHCTFKKDRLIADHWFIKKRMKELNISQISFTDGQSFTLS
ncbi:hypothetical protein AB6C40_14955 [Vibrio splendidus]